MNTRIRIVAVLVMAGGLMFAVGCGYNFARDTTASQNDVAHSMDIATMKDLALSNLATNKCIIVNVGGGNVAELTIDLSLQRIVSEVLARHADTNDTGVGWAILMSVKDGAVLALADCGGELDAPRPLALTKMFEPGHLISTMTVAAAIDAGIVTPDSELCTNASEAFFYQYKLPSDGGHIWESTLSVSNGLIFSSNVVLSKLGILVGRDRESAVLNRFGIGIRSGIGFPDEVLGRLIPPERWCKVDRARIPIGQGIEITAIQIARAYSTLANHGRRVDPYIIKRITDKDGATLYEHEASTNIVQAVSPRAADLTCGILEGAVKADDLKGIDEAQDEATIDIAKSMVPRRATGWRASTGGAVNVAGKTSTMLRMKPGSYECEENRCMASFAGYYPAEDPQYVLVVCYETRRIEGVPYLHQGGGRPAIAFAEVVKRMCYGKMSREQ